MNIPYMPLNISPIMSKPTKPAKPAKAVIKWKNPDFNPRLRKWGKNFEYFVADVEIDPQTGEGTIKLRKPTRTL